MLNRDAESIWVVGATTLMVALGCATAGVAARDQAK
jgi:hypothetical protein